MASLNSNEVRDIERLLTSWNLGHLLPTLMEQEINSPDVLKMLRPYHVSELLAGFPLGTKVRFEHSLKEWKRTQLLSDSGVFKMFSQTAEFVPVIENSGKIDIKSEGGHDAPNVTQLSFQPQQQTEIKQ